MLKRRVLNVLHQDRRGLKELEEEDLDCRKHLRHEDSQDYDHRRKSDGTHGCECGRTC